MKSYFTKIFRLYKAAYSGHPQEVWTLVLLSFINRLGMMVIPFLAVYLTTILDFSLKEAGVLTGAFGLGAMGGAYLGGRLTDKIGFRKVIFVSLILNGLFLINLQLATDFYTLLVLFMLTALFGEAYRPAMTASIGTFVPKEETGRTMSFIRLAINMGMSAAFGLGGFIAATLGYHWLFWIDGITCILAAIYFWYSSQQWKEKKSTVVTNSSKTVEQEVFMKPQKNKLYMLFLLASFLMGLAFMQWFQSVPIFIKKEWGYDERYIGILMSVSALIKILFEMPAIHFIELKKKINIAFLSGLFLIGLSFLPFLFPQSLVYCFIAMFIFTAGEIFYMPFNNSIALNMSPLTMRGEYMAWYWMVWSLTFVVGPSIGLYFAETFGFSLFWILLMSLVSLSWALHYYLAKKIID